MIFYYNILNFFFAERYHTILHLSRQKVKETDFFLSLNFTGVKVFSIFYLPRANWDSKGIQILEKVFFGAGQY